MSKQSFERSMDKLGNFADQATEFAEAFAPFPNVRMGSGITNRDEQVISWRLPNGTAIQMYINPQRLSIQENKQINAVRTKGGYIVQYWGNELSQITIEGHTGSSGIKGINILRDIYNAENRGFELVAASQTNSLMNQLGSGDVADAALADQLLPTMLKSLENRSFILRPSLASLATSIIMFYQGIQYRGFFKSFSVNESVDQMGLFAYTINFTVTETRGRRENFLPWHKEPNADDLGSQLLNGIGNSIRSAIGLSEQPPTSFHPENAPLSFGGNELAAEFGLL